MSFKVNFITGITGQDGSYLAELLNDDNDITFAFARSANTSRDLGSLSRFTHLSYYVSDLNISKMLLSYIEGHRLFIFDCDISHQESINHIFENVIPVFLETIYRPQMMKDKGDVFSLYPLRFYFYHMAALSHVHESYTDPEKYLKTNTLGSFYLFKAFVNLFKRFDGLKDHNNQAFFYHAATTELFSGHPDTVPQNSSTPLEPQSPYAVSKLAAFYLLKFELEHLKDGHNIFLRQGILSNHESPRRPAKFVTQKIVCAVRDYIQYGTITHFGNVLAKRDWGYAKDYMLGVIKMMTPESPETLVLGTGVQHSVLDFMKMTVDCYNQALDMKLTVEEIFRFNDPSYCREKEVHSLCIDPSEAAEKIGWEAVIDLKQLIEIMVEDKLWEVGGPTC